MVTVSAEACSVDTISSTTMVLARTCAARCWGVDASRAAGIASIEALAVSQSACEAEANPTVSNSLGLDGDAMANAQIQNASHVKTARPAKVRPIVNVRLLPVGVDVRGLPVSVMVLG